MDANVKDAHNEDEMIDEANMEGRPLPDTFSGPNDGYLKNLRARHGFYALALMVVVILCGCNSYIQNHKGAPTPITKYVNGICMTEYWHVPDRYQTASSDFEEQVSKAMADDAADFRRSEPCNIQNVHRR